MSPRRSFGESVRVFNRGVLTPVDAAKGKWFVTELQKRVVDHCLQLEGGYGYMREYAVAKAYVDARIQTIYGGATEIMKEIIGRHLVPHQDHRPSTMPVARLRPTGLIANAAGSMRTTTCSSSPGT